MFEFRIVNNNTYSFKIFIFETSHTSIFTANFWLDIELFAQVITKQIPLL